jgi:hypothetical protein
MPYRGIPWTTLRPATEGTISPGPIVGFGQRPKMGHSKLEKLGHEESERFLEFERSEQYKCYTTKV